MRKAGSEGPGSLRACRRVLENVLSGGRRREDDLGNRSEAMVGAAQRWWRDGWVQKEAALDAARRGAGRGTANRLRGRMERCCGRQQ